MNPTLVKALEYARTHKTNLADTAIALGISSESLRGLMGNHFQRTRERVQWPSTKTTAKSDDAPLDLIRHVRNGHPYWEQRPAPMGDPGRGPSRPVPPAPSNAAERHHTAVGIAWRMDVHPALVERLRVMLELPAFMTDAEADAISRLLHLRTAPSPPATHTPPGHP